MNVAEQLNAAGVGISHHFGGGTYAKETLIPAGAVLTQHRHDHDHLSVLASGRVKVTVNGAVAIFDGPACLTIKAHAEHEVQAMTDAVWFCIWATDCTDPEKIDEVVG